ncbi:predicted protein [Sclerotinia sclerotiorum 1980 UF-70]|uniref:Uncharacterized protein n=1 Tax=Sclerotinia sclerotiorum (strain ATCC 18683 / 1980 / Ss-1) TaxID=665079 RepID=A7F800_SCLS1|nr:predicted protein [Sclerotinia sclerotiorum 1980 UF-70]EDN98871.1 predicted protein [Sclerotinia sclerotiorum 1980 UF-70]
MYYLLNWQMLVKKDRKLSKVGSARSSERFLAPISASWFFRNTFELPSTAMLGMHPQEIVYHRPEQLEVIETSWRMWVSDYVREENKVRHEWIVEELPMMC